jgi:hypothetical protein
MRLRLYVLLTIMSVVAFGLAVWVDAGTGGFESIKHSAQDSLQNSLARVSGPSAAETRAASWRNARQRSLEAAATTNTQTSAQRLQKINDEEKREYEKGAENRWHAFQDALVRYDAENQAEISKTAKTDPQKAAQMTADYKKFHDLALKQHEDERQKGWTPTVTLPLSPDQP